MANPFVHVELNATDPANAKAFYGSLFNWKMEDVPIGPSGTTRWLTVVQVPAACTVASRAPLSSELLYCRLV